MLNSTTPALALLTTGPGLHSLNVRSGKPGKVRPKKEPMVSQMVQRVKTHNFDTQNPHKGGKRVNSMKLSSALHIFNTHTDYRENTLEHNPLQAITVVKHILIQLKL